MQATQTTTPDLSKWTKNPRVSIDYREGFGCEILCAPCGVGRPQFKLMPKYLKNGYGEEKIVQFYLTYEEGRMLPNWEELLFTPLGFIAPRLERKLPPYSSKEDPTYAKILDPLVTELARSETNIQRLEANIPLYLCHSPESKKLLTIDRVRMAYLPNSVESAPNPDFVLVVFSYLDGYKVMQNGAGGGPPEPGP